MHLRNSVALRCAMFGICLLCAAARGQVDTSGWPQVRVEMLALDPQGEPMAGLTKDALVVKEGKQAHPVLDLQPASGPQSICILIDSSASMYTRLSLVVTKARRLLKSLPPGDEVCVASFSSGLTLDRQLTMDHRAAESGLTRVKGSGDGTALRDSLAAVSDYMRATAQNKSRAIVLFSDGADNSSKANWKKLQQEMELAGSPVVHMVCVPAAFGNARAKQGDPEEGSATRLSRPTGGLTYFPHNMTDINSIVDNLALVLQSRYVLTFQAENAAKDGQEQWMQVSLEKAHRIGHAEVLAPEGYYAPAP
jgi:VWFA-related protein